MKPTDVIVRENYEPLVLIDPEQFDLPPDNPERFFIRETLVEKLANIQSKLPSNWHVRIQAAWRSLKDQQQRYDAYVSLLHHTEPTLSEAELHLRARAVLPDATVNPTAPHVTGGAVDLTFVDPAGYRVNFGTRIGDYSAQSSMDYFDRHAPATKDDNEAKANRQLLQFLMTSEEFVGNPRVWWHWEFGTVTWAASKGIQIARYGATTPFDRS